MLTARYDTTWVQFAQARVSRENRLVFTTTRDVDMICRRHVLCDLASKNLSVLFLILFSICSQFQFLLVKLGFSDGFVVNCMLTSPQESEGRSCNQVHIEQNKTLGYYHTV